MATNLKIDDGLIAEALKLSGFRTKREAVNLALQEFVFRRKQLQALQLESSIEFDPDYDYKQQRLRG
jgi:Arc/MetJ family transcription regulator